MSESPWGIDRERVTGLERDRQGVRERGIESRCLIGRQKGRKAERQVVREEQTERETGR